MTGPQWLTHNPVPPPPQQHAAEWSTLSPCERAAWIQTRDLIAAQQARTFELAAAMHKQTGRIINAMIMIFLVLPGIGIALVFLINHR